MKILQPRCNMSLYPSYHISFLSYMYPLEKGGIVAVRIIIVYYLVISLLFAT